VPGARPAFEVADCHSARRIDGGSNLGAD
jgi:hypothetical protein